MDKKELGKLKKSFGATSIEKKGGSYEIMIDPNKVSAKRRAVLAAGLSRASGGVLNNQPFDATFFEGNAGFSQMNTHQKIKVAMKYFQTDPLAGKIIETMATFANDGLKNEHKDPGIKKIFDNWLKLVGMDQVLDWIFLEYFRSGNVATHRILIPYKNGMLKESDIVSPYWSDASARQEMLEKSMAAKKKDWTKKQIPVAYTVLNPLTVFATSINPYKEDLIENKTYAQKPFNKNDMTEIEVRGFNSELIKDIIKAEGGTPLSSKNVSRILRMRQPYEAYGSVLMERAFSALYEKNKLRQMDMSMTNSAINQIIKVTAGSDEHPATPRHLKALAEQFQNIGKSQTIFWNHTLKIEVIKPDIEVLSNTKYERVNEDIRNAFGISEILTGGGGSKTNFATGYLSLKAFITNLVEARKQVERWLETQYKDVASVLGIDSIPEPSFNSMSLTDEIAEKQIIMQLVDRGIISYETAQNRLGFDSRAEYERRKSEINDIKEGVLGPVNNIAQLVAIEKESIDTQEEVNSNVKTEDKKKPDGMDEKTSQRNRKRGKTVNPSVPLPGNQGGRPKTPKGSYPSKRKTAKIKGQGEESTVLTDNEKKEIILSSAKKHLEVGE